MSESAPGHMNPPSGFEPHSSDSLARPDCLTPDDALGLVEGSLAGEARVRAAAHIARCDECRIHASELVKSSRVSGAVRQEGLDGTIPAETNVGRYVLGRSIGSGAMGIVYEAYDPQLDRRVALKMMRPFSMADLSPDRLQREARAMARIHHPNVVSVYDIGVHDGQLFIAMELVEGATLRDWLRRESPSVREIVDAFVQAGRGVASAHAAGIVHRDFKPENVLRDRLGHVKVTDFGVALAKSAVEVKDALGSDGVHRGLLTSYSSHSVAGTRAYMAPEQHAGRSADARSDQFSFCVALYEALYGSHPFADSAWLDLLEKGEVRRTLTNVPRRVHRALTRGLQIEPGDRHPTMDELLLALSPKAGKWWIAAALVTALVAAVVVPLAHRRDRAATIRVCEARGTRVSDVWSEPRKSVMRQAFMATNKRFAERAWQEIARGLDGYAGSLVAAQSQACEATHVRGEPAMLLELRADCLEDRKRAMAALAGVLPDVDAASLVTAAAAIETLPSVAACQDEKALLLRPKPPAAGPRQPRFALLRIELSRARALSAVGRYPEGLKVAEAALRGAEEIDDRPLQGEALLIYGRLQRIAGQLKEAEETLQKAVMIADSAGDDVTRANALAVLLESVNVLSNDTSGRAVHLNEELGAVVARMGGNLELEAKRHFSFGSALVAQAKYGEAQRALETALALYEKEGGLRSHRATATCLLLLGHADLNRPDLDRAAEHFRRALTVSEESLGPYHPTVGMVLNGLGEVLLEQSRFEEAAALFARAIPIVEESMGADSFVLIRMLGVLGDAMNRLGRYSDALPSLERARAIQMRVAPETPSLWWMVAALGEAHLGVGDRPRAILDLELALQIARQNRVEEFVPIASARLNLAIALWPDPRQRARARRSVLEAREACRSSETTHTPYDAQIVARVDQWIAEHPSR